MRTSFLSAIITLLVLQSPRVFASGLVWVVGETSDRNLLGGLALPGAIGAVSGDPAPVFRAAVGDGNVRVLSYNIR